MTLPGRAPAGPILVPPSRRSFSHRLKHLLLDQDSTFALEFKRTHIHRIDLDTTERGRAHVNMHTVPPTISSLGSQTVQYLAHLNIVVGYCICSMPLFRLALVLWDSQISLVLQLPLLPLEGALFTAVPPGDSPFHILLHQTRYDFEIESSM